MLLGLIRNLRDISVNTIIKPGPNTPFTANVTGFTMRQIWNGVNNSTVRSIPTFRTRLQSLHLSQTGNTLQNYNNLFTAYDVFN